MDTMTLTVQIVSVVVAAVAAAGGAAWLIGRSIADIREELRSLSSDLKSMRALMEKDLDLRDERIQALGLRLDTCQAAHAPEVTELHELRDRVTRLETKMEES